MSLADRPRLLDLFCGAGGAAVGYHRAGFDVVGVDIRPQPNYPFRFMQGDALTWLWSDSPNYWKFDAIHASPPCQHYANVTAWRGNQNDHPDLIGPTRELLEQTGLPWVIENVGEAPLEHPFMLCGTALGLRVRRHRYFETNWIDYTESFGWSEPCRHRHDDYAFDHGAKQPESIYRDAMGVEWMTVEESREAIPPAYTEFVGHQLLAHLKVAA